MPFYPKSESISYADPASDFSRFADLSHTFFLDSSSGAQNGGRYSFWGIDPLCRWESQDGFLIFNGHKQIDSPFDSLKTLYQKILPLPIDPYFPFCGGLVGYFGYEWGAQFENIESLPEEALQMPDAVLSLYDTIVGYDLVEQSCRVLSLGLNDALEPDEELAAERVRQLTEKIKWERKIEIPPFSFSPQKSADGNTAMSREQYLMSVRKILNYLKAGDCYQVNFTQRFTAAAKQNPWTLYSRLRTVSPAPYAAFLNEGSFQILSSSPECFLESKQDGTLLTKPIKGTRKRGITTREDEVFKQELLESQKDQAELLMITDLERNDLGKICRPGSITVPRLRTLETYSQVHHLVSTVRGKRREDCDIIDTIKAMFPGGSITGAPKIRAMEIIRELEPVRRGVYTGAIGSIGPGNTAHLNVAIRTIVLQQEKAYFQSGGGIVIDSDPESEYEESLTKAKGMLEALGE